MTRNFSRKIKSLSYWYCCHCGLLLLGNKESRKQSIKTCNERWDKDD